VRLPDFAVEWTYTPPHPANAVRLSPSGRFLAVWETDDFLFLNSDVNQLTVTVHDRQTGQSTAFTGTQALADVVAEPDSSAFYIALTQWRRDHIEQSSLRIIRVDLAAGLSSAEMTIPSAGHASDLEILGGSSLRLDAARRTLVFGGCTFLPGTCNARLYVLDADSLTLRGDLRGAGAAAFDPTRDRAVAWDGASNDEGKIWVTSCQDANLDPAGPYYVDHWLLAFDTETLDSTVMDLPQLAPYYFVTRDGAFAVVSMENCDTYQLYAVAVDTGAATAIAYASHALHHFTILDDNRSIYSVDLGLLERIDLDTLAATPTGLPHYVSRINRLPGSPRLVLADPDVLTFYLYDTDSDAVLNTQSIDYTPSPPPPPGPAPAPLPNRAVPRIRVPRSRRAPRRTRARRTPRLARARHAGARLGQEQSL
jgi:hypothetical protein